MRDISRFIDATSRMTRKQFKQAKEPQFCIYSYAISYINNNTDDNDHDDNDKNNNGDMIGVSMDFCE